MRRTTYLQTDTISHLRDHMALGHTIINCHLHTVLKVGTALASECKIQKSSMYASAGMRNELALLLA